jgi:hypothetical protein
MWTYTFLLLVFAAGAPVHQVTFAGTGDGPGIACERAAKIANEVPGVRAVCIRLEDK